MRPYSLRARLLGAMGVVLGLGLLASLASYRFAVHNLVSDLNARTLEAQARELARAVQPGHEGEIPTQLPAEWRRVYADASRTFSYTVFDAAGRPLAWSMNLRVPLAYFPAGADGVTPIALTGIPPHERTVLAMRLKGGDTLLVARAGLTQDTLVDSLLEERLEHLSVLLPFVLAALVLTWLTAGWSLRPLARASRAAARVGPREPDLRLSSEALPREIVPLVEAVNGALDRLAQAYAHERRLTEDAAHELRTPLAALTLRLQRARITGSSDWGAIERDLAQMGRLVAQLLDLARKESLAAQEGVARPVINFARVVREVAAAMVPLAEARGRTFELDAPEALAVRGSAGDLGDLVRNLLENALVHGAGVVRLNCRSQDGAVLLEVQDEGSGVPPGQEQSVFERFRKHDPASPGAGLGLAIVRQVARSHGGEAYFLPGRGCITVRLPGAQGSADSAPAAARSHVPVATGPG